MLEPLVHRVKSRYASKHRLEEEKENLSPARPQKRLNAASNAPHIPECPPSPVKSTMDMRSAKRSEFLVKRAALRADQRCYLIYDTAENKWYTVNHKEPNKRTVAQGTFAFVTQTDSFAQEMQLFSRVLVWPIITGQHNNTFHAGLSFFQQSISYAGEVTCEKGVVTDWNNASGTYKPPFKKNKGAVLPIEKFTLPTFSY